MLYSLCSAGAAHSITDFVVAIDAVHSVGVAAIVAAAIAKKRQAS